MHSIVITIKQLQNSTIKSNLKTSIDIPKKKECETYFTIYFIIKWICNIYIADKFYEISFWFYRLYVIFSLIFFHVKITCSLTRVNITNNNLSTLLVRNHGHTNYLSLAINKTNILSAKQRQKGTLFKNLWRHTWWIRFGVMITILVYDNIVYWEFIFCTSKMFYLKLFYCAKVAWYIYVTLLCK